MPEPGPATVVELARVEEPQRDTLDRLLQLYLHDFSEFADIDSPFGEVQENGRFPYAHLDSYFIDRDREALAIRAGGRLAGFVLINRWFPSGIPADHAVAEFFVLRKYRRAGIGTLAARSLFERRPGTWELGIADYNRPALAFWRSALASIDGIGALSERPGDGKRWTGTVMRFTMAGRRDRTDHR